MPRKYAAKIYKIKQKLRTIFIVLIFPTYEPIQQEYGIQSKEELTEIQEILKRLKKNTGEMEKLMNCSK